MKTKLLLSSVLCLLSSGLHGSLIDRTPGGFFGGNAPPLLYEVVGRTHGHGQLAAATINGTFVDWTLQNEPFGPDQFGVISDGTSATVSWNLSLTGGYHLEFILVEGTGAWDNIYSPRTVDRYIGNGSVTVDGTRNFVGIVFYGGNIVPDKDSTLLLFIVAWAILAPAGSLMFGHFWRRRL